MPTIFPRFAVLCLFFIFHCGSCNRRSKPDPNKQDTQQTTVIKTDFSNTRELLKNLKNISDDQLGTVLLDKIVQRSTFQESQGNNDSIFFFDSLLLYVATRAKNLNYIAKGQSYLAYDYRTSNKTDSAYHYYNLAQKSYKKIGDSLQVGRKLLNMAKIQQRQAAYYQSKETITEALDFLDPIKNADYYAVALNDLANNYVELEEFPLAEELYEQAIASDVKKTDKIIYANNLANLFANTNRREKAILVFKSQIKNLPKGFDKAEKARLEHNLASNEWKLNKKNPLPVFFNALSIRKEKNDSWGLLSSYGSLFHYFLEMDDYVAAERYMDSLLAVSKSLNNPNVEVESLSSLLERNPKKYAERIPNYLKLRDSINKKRQTYKNQFAYLKYMDSQEKQHLLSLESETVLQEKELARQTVQKSVLVSFLLLVLVGTVAFYFVLQQRNKRQKLKEIYKTEQRISEELHNGLANKVFGLMTKIEGSTTEGKSILEDLENIYQTTRKISHKNASIKLGTDFKNELSNLIDVYQNKRTTIVTTGLNGIDWYGLGKLKCIVLHRCLTELLVNMKKHSEATLVSIQFNGKGKKISITYTDNGVGIPASSATGIGLEQVKSALKSIGGKLNILEHNASGTKIELTIP